METPDLPPRDAFRFSACLQTRWSDEDNHGLLNNAVYLTLFEEARHAYFSQLGAMEGRRFPFVLAQSNVAFLAPGRGAVPVEVDTMTIAIGRTSLSQVYRVRDIISGQVWCEAEARLVFVDADGKKCALPESLRRDVQLLEKRDYGA